MYFLNCNSTQFQSTLPRRERRTPTRSRWPTNYFNPRSREGSDSAAIARVSAWPNFNPRSREGSDGSNLPQFVIDKLFQSTLPRRERRGELLQDGVHIISIHAPAKGATCFGRPKNYWSRFQSTLPRRERPHCGVQERPLQIFQSTLPRRERPFSADASPAARHISIHAPAKGATQEPPTSA